MTSLIRELMAMQDQHDWLSDQQLAGLAERFRARLHRSENASFCTRARRTSTRGGR